MNSNLYYNAIDLEALALSISKGPDSETKIKNHVLENLLRQAQHANVLTAKINTPHLTDFLEAVRFEAVHQQDRWKTTDPEKTMADWYWTLGYLGGKALYSAMAGDKLKAMHHCITAAAMCYNWCEAIKK